MYNYYLETFRSDWFIENFVTQIWNDRFITWMYSPWFLHILVSCHFFSGIVKYIAIVFALLKHYLLYNIFRNASLLPLMRWNMFSRKESRFCFLCWTSFIKENHISRMKEITVFWFEPLLWRSPGHCQMDYTYNFFIKLKRWVRWMVARVLTFSQT